MVRHKKLSAQMSAVDEIQGNDAEAQASSPPRRTPITTSNNTTTMSEDSSTQSQDIDPSDMVSSRIPLLICSIGNPGIQYANTFHSAGHVILQRLAYELHYGGWENDRALGGVTTRTPPAQQDRHDWTLWQSPVLMNISGRAVHNAYKAWSRNLPEGVTGRLIIVHDELEKPTGAATFKTNQGGSAKGHNGLKSILEVFSGSQVPFFRIGVGIGRPVSRDPNDVSTYVLAKMSKGVLDKLDGALPSVIKSLEQAERLKEKK